ncbi:dihydropteroate synthase [Aquimarina sp. ERC-38]|uniref:dihydropteroate synthase n=1 Tax=Aquimarina sp. ERC-38 TaxID=2949996 RepID=UPI002246B0C1|nr:dihydropteroate synthase [Aquimarina sp. ERC-38]UZO81022.1 dihydropteroate synthase [Aquimarina sp. ERC-38]
MTINCKGSLIDISTPKVMGILNLTPDSFYDGGKYKDEKGVLVQVEKMLTEGATFIDIGAYSSRPGADHISEEEEKKRLLPIIKLLCSEFPEILISIDTFRSTIAKEGITCGAAMINDISAGMLDDEMIATIGKLQVPYVMMHMKGTPQTMKDLNQYEDMVREIQFYFSERIAVARHYGINDVIIDPGFGFAKSIKQNFELLQKLELFKFQNVPILAGVSRKSMIYKTLGTTAKEALNGTTVLNTVALQNGVSILRVHDVKEAVECIKLVEELGL